MKFRPIPYGNESPFCSARSKGHWISARPGHTTGGQGKCEECSAPVTDADSDHMCSESRGHALLCLACADTYKEMYELTRLVMS